MHCGGKSDTGESCDSSDDDGRDRVVDPGDGSVAGAEDAGIGGEGAVGSEATREAGSEKQSEYSATTLIGPAPGERLEKRAQEECSEDIDQEDADWDSALGRYNQADGFACGGAGRATGEDETEVPPPQMDGPGRPV